MSNIDKHARREAIISRLVSSFEPGSITDKQVDVLSDAVDLINDLFSDTEAHHKSVTLPTGYSVRPGHPINETERSVMIPKDGGQWLSRFDVEHALRVAGIRINGEG